MIYAAMLISLLLVPVLTPASILAGTLLVLMVLFSALALIHWPQDDDWFWYWC